MCAVAAALSRSMTLSCEHTLGAGHHPPLRMRLPSAHIPYAIVRRPLLVMRYAQILLLQPVGKLRHL